MDRTDEFFDFFSEYNNIGSASKFQDKNNNTYLNEASNKILNLLQTIDKSIEETRDSFIDQYQIILAKKSDMNDDERILFEKQTSLSLEDSEKFIQQLTENVKSGKMRLKGNSIDHAIGVITCLNSSLNKIKRKFVIMKAQREQVQLKLNTIKANPPSITSTYTKQNHSQYNQEFENKSENSVRIDQEFQQQLEQEHDSVLNELLDFHDQLNQTERITEEIATLTRTFNELMIEQTERIIVIKSDIEKATENYETGTKEVNKSINRTKFQHLWMSLVILFLSFVLVLKHS